MYYMVRTYPFFGGVAVKQWFNMNPVSAGTFGMPIGLLTPEPSKDGTGPGRVRALPAPARRHLDRSSVISSHRSDKARSGGLCFLGAAGDMRRYGKIRRSRRGG